LNLLKPVIFGQLSSNLHPLSAKCWAYTSHENLSERETTSE